MSDKKSWYIVQVYSGFEKYVQKALTERIASSELKDFFGDLLIPTEEVIELRSGQKRKTERKFFPGYILVNMEMNDDTWYLVKKTPKVLNFIGGTANSPVAISDKEADLILRKIADSSDKPKPKVLYEVGEVVRVNEGPFADFTGVVEDVNYEKGRLRVAVLIFGRSTPVELNFSQVEKS